MDIEITSNKAELGKAAARAGGEAIRHALADRGFANIIVATGASQFDMLAQLVQESDIDWQKVTGFQLDEYVELSITHPASFRRYLWQRFVSRLPLPMRAFYYLNGEDDADAECRRIGDIIQRHPIDVAFVGIGENGHLAFNDPPADFISERPYLVVRLDDACRKQQLGEGWFPTFNDVPKQAISMSVQQIMKSRAIICTVPDERKAEAVRKSVQGSVSPQVPASILQHHKCCKLFLDKPAASQLTG